MSVWVSASLMAVFLGPAAHAQIGDALGGVGPINRSMGGAAVAAPIDAAGARFWNPASIAGLSSSELESAIELIDLRFLDFRDANGFRHAGFNRDGAAAGRGWQNVFALATGVQYQCTDSLTLRAGYTFNLDGASNSVTMFNLLSPTIIQHSLACGFTYNVSKAFKVSVAYVHFFENSIHGPIVTSRTGPTPGTDVKNSATADSVLLGATVSF
jgi:long-subunit fatty acid transport protein